MLIFVSVELGAGVKVLAFKNYVLKQTKIKILHSLIINLFHSHVYLLIQRKSSTLIKQFALSVS